MRVLALSFVIGTCLAFGSSLASAQSTTRIEPRPFYGATVTLEEGVRVFRPLPPHDRVIINPGNKTPLSLAISESHNYSYNEYNNSEPAKVYPAPYYDQGAYVAPFTDGHRGQKPRHGRASSIGGKH
jgi:hypothetical protein